MNMSGPEAASYAGAVSSIAAGLTLNDIGVIFGMLTALVTCIATVYASVVRAKADAQARLLEAQARVVEAEHGHHVDITASE